MVVSVCARGGGGGGAFGGAACADARGRDALVARVHAPIHPEHAPHASPPTARASRRRGGSRIVRDVVDNVRRRPRLRASPRRAHFWFSIFFERRRDLAARSATRPARHVAAPPNARACCHNARRRRESPLISARYVVGPLAGYAGARRTGACSARAYRDERATRRRRGARAVRPAVARRYIRGRAAAALAHRHRRPLPVSRAAAHAAARGKGVAGARGSARLQTAPQARARSAGAATAKAEARSPATRASCWRATRRAATTPSLSSSSCARARWSPPDALVALSHPWLELAPSASGRGDYMPSSANIDAAARVVVACGCRPEACRASPTGSAAADAGGWRRRRTFPRRGPRARSRAANRRRARRVLVEVPKGVHDCFFLPFFDRVPGAATSANEASRRFVPPGAVRVV